MGAEMPKQYLQVQGRSILEHTLYRLAGLEVIEAIVVAINTRDKYWPCLQLDITKPLHQAAGGDERCHSVLSALNLLETYAQPHDWVLIHDAARPCVRPSDLEKLVRELQEDPVGGLLARPVRDTMKHSADDRQVASTVDRRGLWHALTPQMFRYESLRAALLHTLDKEMLVTDESSAMEFAGYHPRLVEGQADNIKITCPEDLALADFYLSQQAAQGIGPAVNGMDDGG